MKGKLILIPLAFTDFTSTKLRPALVLSLVRLYVTLTMPRIIVIEGERVTLPREFRKQAKVRKGDLLEYRVQDGALLLSKPAKVENPTKRLFGIASGVSTDLTGDALFLEEVKAKLRRSK